MAQVKPRQFRERIERILADEEWDVVCRKRNEGYSLLWADDGEPLARFKPVGSRDDVEIFWWNGERWRPVGEFGCVLPLDEALEFVFDDPDGLFFDRRSVEDKKDQKHLPDASPVRPAMRFIFGTILVAGTIGGALGGLFSEAAYGLAGGAVFGCVALISLCLRSAPLRLALTASAVLGLPTIFAGAVGGTLGAALNEAVATQWWGRFAGLLVGGLGSILALNGGRTTGVLSSLAGIAFGLWLVGTLNISQMHWACLLTTAIAFGFADLGRWIAGFRIVSTGRTSEWAERKAKERKSRGSRTAAK